MGPGNRLRRRLADVAKAAGGGYRRLQMPLELAFVVRKKASIADHLNKRSGTTV